MFFFLGGVWFEQCLLEKDRRAKQKGGHFDGLGSTFGRRSGSTPKNQHVEGTSFAPILGGSETLLKRNVLYVQNHDQDTISIKRHNS